MADGNPLILGIQNTSTSTTRVQRAGAALTPAFTVANSNGNAIVGSGSAVGVGVRGESEFFGLFGFSTTGIAIGALCQSGHGIWGESPNRTGVHGESDSSIGVHGNSDDSTGTVGTSDRGTGVFGFSRQNSGVHGDERGGQFGQAGVKGTSLESAGVFGRSDNAIGVFGEHLPVGLSTTPPAGIGVLGRAHPRDSRGVIGFSRSGFGIGAVTSSGFAGVFEGNVFVRGNATITGSKSAAVPHPDGSLRALFAVESPQSWFEDFGRAELRGDRMTVELDPDFCELIDTSEYHVFLTPEGECGALFVAERNPRAFDVRESGQTHHEVSFSYRVVARRRDIDAERLPIVNSPDPVLAENFVDIEGPGGDAPLIQIDDRPVLPDEVTEQRS
jgi:hypothetical protein